MSHRLGLDQHYTPCKSYALQLIARTYLSTYYGLETYGETNIELLAKDSGWRFQAIVHLFRQNQVSGQYIVAYEEGLHAAM